MYTYIYIYRERERKREIETKTKRESLYFGLEGVPITGTLRPKQSTTRAHGAFNSSRSYGAFRPWRRRRKVLARALGA